MTVRRLAALLAIGLVGGAVPAAGQPTSAIAVEPERCFPGGAIRVDGFVKPESPTPRPVTLRFIAPVSGDTITESVPVEPNGDYEHVFDRTHEAGTWRVEASHRGRPAGTATWRRSTPSSSRRLAFGALRVANLAVARRYLDADPAVQAGTLVFELRPWTVTLPAAGD